MVVQANVGEQPTKPIGSHHGLFRYPKARYSIHDTRNILDCPNLEYRVSHIVLSLYKIIFPSLQQVYFV